MSVQSSLVMYPIYAFGSEAQKDKYLPKLRTGEYRRLLRPDRARCRLRPRLHAHHAPRRSMAAIVLNGAKTWITNSPDRRRAAGLGQGRCRRHPRLHGRTRRARASTTPKIEGKFSLRASVTGKIMLPDVFVPDDAMLPDVQGPARPVLLPQQGALRHRLGRDGRGGVLLARRARLYAGAQDVRPAAGRHPAGAEEAGRHADRDHARPARRAAPGPADRCRRRPRPK